MNEDYRSLHASEHHPSDLKHISPLQDPGGHVAYSREGKPVEEGKRRDSVVRGIIITRKGQSKIRKTRMKNEMK